MSPKARAQWKKLRTESRAPGVAPDNCKWAPDTADEKGLFEELRRLGLMEYGNAMHTQFRLTANGLASLDGLEPDAAPQLRELTGGT